MMKKLLAVLLTAAMLLSMVAITAAASEKSSFPDTENNWAEKSIARWVENGVVHGTDTGLFQPGKKMTRAEFATILCQLLKINNPGDASFSDLKGHWGAKAMLTLANAGIMAGVGGGKADPNGLITREQAFALLARALHIPASTSEDKLPGVSGWAQGTVKALTERGIVKGTVSSDGTVELAPLDKIDKASMMSLLDRTITTYANKPGSYENTAQNGVALVVTDGEVVISGEAAAVVVPSAGEGANVTLDKAVVTEGVTVDAPEVGLTVNNSKVDGGVALTENADKANVAVASGSTVDTVTTAANEVSVSGEGEVKNVEVTGGDKVDVTTAGTSVKVDEAAKDAAVTAGGAEVKPGENTTIDGAGTGYEEPGTQPSTPPVDPSPDVPGPNPGGDETEKFTVTFDLNGAEGTNPTLEVEKGGKATAPATGPERTGYDFGGWYKEAACTNGWNFSTDTVTENTTLYAKWTIKTYTITFDANYEGAADEFEPLTFEHGHVINDDEIATFPVPTRTGYEFDGWYTDPGCADETYFNNGEPVTSNITLYAKWLWQPAFETVTLEKTDFDHMATAFKDQYNQPNTSPTGKGVQKIAYNTAGISEDNWFINIPFANKPQDAPVPTITDITLADTVDYLPEGDTVSVSVGNRRFIQGPMYKIDENGLKIAFPVLATTDATETETGKALCFDVFVEDLETSVSVSINLDSELALKNADATAESLKPNNFTVTGSAGTYDLEWLSDPGDDWHGWADLMRITMTGTGIPTGSGTNLYFTKKDIDGEIAYGVTANEAAHDRNTFCVYPPTVDCDLIYTATSLDRYGPVTLTFNVTGYTTAPAP